jgi:hypothetical protein
MEATRTMETTMDTESDSETDTDIARAKFKKTCRPDDCWVENQDDGKTRVFVGPKFNAFHCLMCEQSITQTTMNKHMGTKVDKTSGETKLVCPKHGDFAASRKKRPSQQFRHLVSFVVGVAANSAFSNSAIADYSFLYIFLMPQLPILPHNPYLPQL